MGGISHRDWKECYQNVDVMIMPNMHAKDDVKGFDIIVSGASLARRVVIASNENQTMHKVQ